LLTIVIVNYASWPDVLRLARALAFSPEIAAGVGEVVVVDNASPGPVPDELAGTGRWPGVRLVARPDNGGFAAGVNAGRLAARSPWLLVLNPDVDVPDGELARIVARVQRFESDRAASPGIVGFALKNPDGSPQPSVGAFPSLARTLWEQLIPRSRRKYQAGWRIRSGPVAWVTGACMLIDVCLLDDLGGMDEDFFLYYEEVALCHSAHKVGRRVEFDAGVAVVHRHPLQNRAVSPKMRIITRHSKLLYFRKHLPRWQFAGLSWIVSTEATIRGVGAMVQGRTESVRAWQAIGALARAFRSESAPTGRAVLAMAEAATAPNPRVSSRPWWRSVPVSVGLAGKRRGAGRGSPLAPRKDGRA
jgi:GT2 family glycosyltransferase